MIRFLLFFLPCLIISCGSLDKNDAQLTTEVDANAPKAQALHEKGKQKEAKSDWSAAAKQYDIIAARHPSYAEAETLSFHAAQLWEKNGSPAKAFESYQTYIKTFRNGDKYGVALDRQAEIAFGAAKGALSSKFLGMTQEPQYDTVVGFLTRVRDNAPASDLAARAQFAVGTYSESKKKDEQAVAAYYKVADDYPNHSLAAEATLRAGKTLAGITAAGNQNSSNLLRSKRTLEDLIQQYPNTTQAVEAKSLLQSLHGKSAQSTFNIAEFYKKKGQFSSAKYYYQEVVNTTTEGSPIYLKAQQNVNEL